MRPNGAKPDPGRIAIPKEPNMESRDHFLRFAIAAALVLVGGLALAVQFSTGS
jgi:hypothetical protein